MPCARGARAVGARLDLERIARGERLSLEHLRTDRGLVATARALELDVLWPALQHVDVVVAARLDRAVHGNAAALGDRCVLPGVAKVASGEQDAQLGQRFPPKLVDMEAVEGAVVHGSRPARHGGRR